MANKYDGVYLVELFKCKMERKWRQAKDDKARRVANEENTRRAAEEEDAQRSAGEEDALRESDEDNVQCAAEVEGTHCSAGEEDALRAADEDKVQCAAQCSAGEKGAQCSAIEEGVQCSTGSFVASLGGSCCTTTDVTGEECGGMTYVTMRDMTGDMTRWVRCLELHRARSLSLSSSSSSRESPRVWGVACAYVAIERGASRPSYIKMGEGGPSGRRSRGSSASERGLNRRSY